MNRWTPCAALLAAAMFLAHLGVAIAQEATPAGTEGVVDEVLCEVDVPVEYFPVGDAVVALSLFTLNPGVVAEYGEGDTVDSVVADCILEGGEIAHSDGPILVVRGDGTSEEVAPGMEAAASAGEAVVYLENELPQSITSAAEGRTVVLSSFILATASAPCEAEGNCAQAPAGLQVENFGTIPVSEWATFASAPVTLTFRRIVLAPGASYPLPADQSASSWFVYSGDMTVESTSGPREYAEGRAFLGSALAPDATFMNAGDEPVVLWNLTLSAAGGDATPVATTPQAARL